MFNGCEMFDGDISNWKVGNVKYMSGMFYGCKNFNQDISGWDVSKVTNMSHMFHGCEKFNQQFNWNVSNVINMEYMFYYCLVFNNGENSNNDNGDDGRKDLLNWDVSKVTNMSNMFYGCNKFDNKKQLKWIISAETSMTDIFNKNVEYNILINKTNTIKTNTNNHNDDSEPECGICFEVITNEQIYDNKKCNICKCGMMFHNECIEQWYKNSDKQTCPYCKTGEPIEQKCFCYKKHFDFR